MKNIKKTITCLLAVMTVLTVSAQQSTVFQPKQAVIHYPQDSIDTRCVFEFNENGTLALQSCYHGNDNAPSTYSYMYDDELQLIEEHDIMQGIIDDASPRYVHEYHHYWVRNNHHTEKYEKWARFSYGDSLELAERILYQYDEQGALADRSFYLESYLGDGSEDLCLLVKTFYRQSGTDSVTVYTYPSLSLPESTKRVTNSYLNGFLTQKLTEEWMEDSYSDVQLEEYTYSDNRLVGVEIKTKENGVWQNNKETSYLRDNQGNLVETIYRKWDGNQYVNDKRTVYERNSQGLLVFVSFETYQGGSWIEGASDFQWNMNSNAVMPIDSLFTDPLLSRFNFLLRWGGLSSISIEYEQTANPNYQISENGSDPSVSAVSPNPTTGLVVISGRNLIRAEIYNTMGQRVAYVQGKGEQFIIDMSELCTGVYFVSVTDENGKKYVRKVVKQ